MTLTRRAFTGLLAAIGLGGKTVVKDVLEAKPEPEVPQEVLDGIDRLVRCAVWPMPERPPIGPLTAAREQLKEQGACDHEFIGFEDGNEPWRCWKCRELGPTWNSLEELAKLKFRALDRPKPSAPTRSKPA